MALLLQMLEAAQEAQPTQIKLVLDEVYKTCSTIHYLDR